MKALKNEILEDQQQLTVETNGDVGTVTRIGNYKNFNTPVKTIIAAGCPNSGWQKVLPVLEEAGLEPASDTFARWHDELLRTVGMSGPLQSDLLWRQGPEIGGIVAETPTAPLLLADSRCLWLLDFWAAKLPQAKFLLFYIHAEAAVAHACTQGIEPQQFLEDWQAANRQLLRFQRCHRRRALLLDAEAAGRQPHGLIETCRHIGLTLHAPSEIPPTDPPAATMERLLADYLVATKPDVQALEAELEATAQPLADDMPAEPLHPVDLVSSFLQQQAYKRGLQQALNKTDQKLLIAEQAQEQQTAQIRQLTNDLGDQTDLAAACQVQLDQLQLTVQERDAAIASLHEELNNRQDEIGRLQWYLGERDADIVHLNENLAARNAELSRMEHELHTQLDEKRKAVADLQTQLEQVTQTKDQLVREAAEQQQALETLFREQDESAQETSELQAQVQELIQERDAQDKLTSERQATIKQLTKTQDEQVKRVADQQAQMEQAQKDHQKLEAANKESVKENELLLLQLHQVQEELETAFVQTQQLEQAKKDQDIQQQLEAKLEQLTSASDEQAKQNSERQNQFEQVQKAHQTLEATHKEAAKENEMLLLQLHQVQEELEETFLRNQNLKQAYQRLEANNKKATQDNKVLSRELKEVRKNLLNKDRELEKQLQRNARLKKTTSWKITAPIRAVVRPFRKSDKKKDDTKELVEPLKASGLFDEAWYLAENEDVAAGGFNPVEHYLLYGAAEGRNPSPKFDTIRYLEINPDVAERKMNPLVHFVKFGIHEGRCVSC